MKTSWRGTTGRSGSPSRPGCTQGKCPKSVKFSTWRAASQRPEQVPFDLAAELHLKFDAVAVAYRKAMRGLGLATSAPESRAVAGR